jgi:hypothetical protein
VGETRRTEAVYPNLPISELRVLEVLSRSPDGANTEYIINQLRQYDTPVESAIDALNMRAAGLVRIDDSNNVWITDRGRAVLDRQRYRIDQVTNPVATATQAEPQPDSVGANAGVEDRAGASAENTEPVYSLTEKQLENLNRLRGINPENYHTDAISILESLNTVQRIHLYVALNTKEDRKDYVLYRMFSFAPDIARSLEGGGRDGSESWQGHTAEQRNSNTIQVLRVLTKLVDEHYGEGMSVDDVKLSLLTEGVSPEQSTEEPKPIEMTAEERIEAKVSETIDSAVASIAKSRADDLRRYQRIRRAEGSMVSDQQQAEDGKFVYRLERDVTEQVFQALIDSEVGNQMQKDGTLLTRDKAVSETQASISSQSATEEASFLPDPYNVSNEVITEMRKNYAIVGKLNGENVYTPMKNFTAVMRQVEQALLDYQVD